jgi:alkanesulfonate monooxygenase SsuD/methylene tetrahydromethanopterin reductase-like flavin-dependent oxidoreductase (luciferase family)
VLVPPARRDLPILIAAKRPRMLGLTARHADAWNMAWFGLPDERLANLRGELREACARVGRDPATLTDTVGVIVGYPDAAWPSFEPTTPSLSGTPAEIADGLAAHAAAGADHLIVVLEPCTPATVAEFSKALALYRSGVAA